MLTVLIAIAKPFTVYPQPDAAMIFPDVPRCSPMRVPFELSPTEYTDISWTVNGTIESLESSFHSPLCRYHSYP